MSGRVILHSDINCCYAAIEHLHHPELNGKRYFEEAHIEKCKGSVSDNVNYVKKTGKWETDESKQEKKIEGTFEEYGTQPPDSKGKRSDMSELYQMVLDNMTNAEILAQNQDYILQIDKIDKVRTTILTEK